MTAPMAHDDTPPPDLTGPDDADAGADQQDGQGAPQRRPPDALEWAASAVALLLVVTTLGYLIWHTTQPNRPVTFEVRATEVQRRAGRFYQQVEVRNLGRQSAGAVGVRGEVRRPGQPTEEARASLDWLPAESSAEVTLLFRGDPQAGTLRLEIEGYSAP